MLPASTALKRMDAVRRGLRSVDAAAAVFGLSSNLRYVTGFSDEPGELIRPGFDGGSVSRNMKAWREETVRHGERIEVPGGATRASGTTGARLGSTDLGCRS